MASIPSFTQSFYCSSSFLQERSDFHTPSYEKDMTKLFHTRLGMGLGLTSLAVGAFYLSPIPMTAGLTLFLISAGFNYYTDKRDCEERVKDDERHVNQMLSFLVSCEDSVHTWKKDILNFVSERQYDIVRYISQYGKADSIHRSLTLPQYDWINENSKKYLQDAHIIKLAEEAETFDNKMNDGLSFKEAIEKYNSSEGAIRNALSYKLSSVGFATLVKFLGKIENPPLKLGEVTINADYYKLAFLSASARGYTSDDVKIFKELFNEDILECYIPSTVGTLIEGVYKFEETFKECLKLGYISAKSEPAIEFARYIMKKEIGKAPNLESVLFGSKDNILFLPFLKEFTWAIVAEKQLIEIENEIDAIEHPQNPELKPSEESLRLNIQYQELLKRQKACNLVIDNFKANIPITSERD